MDLPATPEDYDKSLKEKENQPKKYSLLRKIWYVLVPFYPGRAGWPAGGTIIPEDELKENKKFWTYYPFIFFAISLLAGLLLLLFFS